MVDSLLGQLARIDQFNSITFVRGAELSGCRGGGEDEHQISLTSLRIDANQSAELDGQAGFLAHLMDKCLPGRFLRLDATPGSTQSSLLRLRVSSTSSRSLSITAYAATEKPSL